jgi:hypothetical protein
MQLPPIVVHSTNIDAAKDAIESYLGVNCVKTCTIEEQNCAHISFNKIDKSESVQGFTTLLKSGDAFSVYHNHILYTIESMYFDI